MSIFDTRGVASEDSVIRPLSGLFRGKMFRGIMISCIAEIRCQARKPKCIEQDRTIPVVGV